MKMQTYIKYIFTILMFFLTSCLEEQLLEAKADFQFTEVSVQDGKNVVFTNLSKNAEIFEWTFENGSPQTSTLFNPGQVKFTLVGTHQIKLKVSNKDGSTSETIKTVTIK